MWIFSNGYVFILRYSVNKIPHTSRSTIIIIIINIVIIIIIIVTIIIIIIIIINVYLYKPCWETRNISSRFEPCFVLIF